MDKLEYRIDKCQNQSAKQLLRRIEPQIMGWSNFREKNSSRLRIKTLNNILILITLVPIFLSILSSFNCQIQRNTNRISSAGEFSSHQKASTNVSLHIHPVRRLPLSLDKSRLAYRDQEPQESKSLRSQNRELPEQTTTKIQQHQSNIATATADNGNRSIGHNKWRQFESIFGKELSNFADLFKKSASNLMGQANISSACYSSLNILINSLDQQQFWASQIIDSSARHIPSGIFDGTFNELGNFDQCLAIKYPHNNSITNQLVSGQYCNVIIKPPVINNNLNRMSAFQTVCSLKKIHQAYPLVGGQANETLLFYLKHSQLFQYIRLHLGLCTPSSCSKFELQQMLNIYLHKYQLSGQVKSCQVLTSTENNYIGSHFDSLQLGIL